MAQKATSLFGRIFNFENATIILCFIPIFLFRYTFILFPGALGYGPFIAFYLLLPIFIIKYKIPFRELAWVVFILIVGASGVISGVLQNSVYIKVAGSIILPYVFYAYVWRHFEYNVERLFTLYLKGAYAISIIGILLFVDSFLGNSLLEFFQLFISIKTIDASFGIRLASMLGEPTYFANVVLPAGVVAMFRLIVKQDKGIGLDYLTKRKALVFVVALLLTYSAIAFLGLFLGGILLLLRHGAIRYAIIIPLIVIFARIVIFQVPELEDRYQGALSVSTEEKQTGDFHGSSFILFNHAYITWMNLKENPLFGTGLGTHAIATEKYSLGNKGVEYHYRTQNAQDASSMLLRILSELGLFGGILVFIFLKRNFIPRVPEDPVLWLISTAIFVTIVMQLLRQGNYILNGFPFFVLGFVFTRHTFNQRHIFKITK
ncbi:MAG: O-antigen ligase family protein [Flavobacteriales bacterium]|nr:O-antigen ligase family protein [Flavobacteriales bacterium]